MAFKLRVWTYQELLLPYLLKFFGLLCKIVTKIMEELDGIFERMPFNWFGVHLTKYYRFDKALIQKLFWCNFNLVDIKTHKVTFQITKFTNSYRGKMLKISIGLTSSILWKYCTLESEFQVCDAVNFFDQTERKKSKYYHIWKGKVSLSHYFDRWWINFWTAKNKIGPD